jgi:hypothetical protein
MTPRQELWLNKIFLLVQLTQGPYKYRRVAYGDKLYQPITEFLIVNKYLEPEGEFYIVSEKGIRYLEEAMGEENSV